MAEILEFFRDFQWWNSYWAYIEQMSEKEILLLVLLCALLLVLSFYRWFGFAGAAALLVFLFLLFVVYRADLYGTYLERQHQESLHEQSLLRELDKDLVTNPNSP